MARVTLAISTFNSAAHLERCLSHLLHQSSIQHCEVIVIDSGSEQNEMAVCRSFEGRFPVFRFLRTPRETLYAAWNRALEMSTGEFFVNVNTDDSMEPEALELLVAALDAHPEAVLAYGDWVSSPVPNPDFPLHPAYRRIRHEPYHPRIPLFYCFTGCHQFWRKAYLQSIGGFNGERHAAGDYEAAASLIRNRRHAVYLPRVISGFFHNERGLSLSSSRSMEEASEIQEALWRDLCISDVFEVREGSASDEAAAWCELGWQAWDVGVPWANGPVSHTRFANECATRASRLDPRGREVALLRAAARSSRIPLGLWPRLLKRFRRLRIGACTARTPSPVFGR